VIRLLAFVVVTVGCAGASVPLAPVAPVAPAVPGVAVVPAAPPPVPVEAPVPDGATSPVAAVPSPPTWETIFARYFGPGTAGACGQPGKCHAQAMADAASSYAWLTQRGYIAGTQSPLVSPLNSCLRWFGGNMPPRGAANDEAIRDLQAWVAAGAADR